MSAGEVAAPRTPAGRTRAAAFAALLVGGVLGLIAGSQAWWTASGEGARVTFSGNEATGGLTWAIAAVVLAGLLLALVLRARGRQVVAVVLALSGAGMAVVGLLRQPPNAEGVRTRLAQISLVDSFALASTAWPWVYAGAGVLVTAGALLMLVRATRWPVRTARFERGAPVTGVELADDPTRAWQALDAGEDPTVAAPDAGGPSPTSAPGDAADPDVQSESTGDTMGVHGAPHTHTRRESS